MRMKIPKFTKLPKRAVMPKTKRGAAPRLNRATPKRAVGSSYGRKRS